MGFGLVPCRVNRNQPQILETGKEAQGCVYGLLRSLTGTEFATSRHAEGRMRHGKFKTREGKSDRTASVRFLTRILDFYPPRGIKPLLRIYKANSIAVGELVVEMSQALTQSSKPSRNTAISPART